MNDELKIKLLGLFLVIVIIHSVSITVMSFSNGTIDIDFELSEPIDVFTYPLESDIPQEYKDYKQSYIWLRDYMFPINDTDVVTLYYDCTGYLYAEHKYNIIDNDFWFTNSIKFGMSFDGKHDVRNIVFYPGFSDTTCWEAIEKVNLTVG